MKELFLNYEQSLALKELGFDEPCFGNWQDMKEETPWFSKSYADNQNQYYGQLCSAPTFSQAFRWFREKYNLPNHIHTIWQHDWNDYSYQWHITENKKEWNCIEHFKTYEEAENACIDKLINIAENKKV